ncbi:MAG: hypothetical protein AMXMBFR84_26010 [Candidatus Hydrogenedentota bacterium]
MERVSNMTRTSGERTEFGKQPRHAPQSSIQQQQEAHQGTSEQFLGANKERRDKPFSLWQFVKDLFSLGW